MKKITKIEFEEGKIIAFEDEDDGEIRIGISESCDLEDMFYCSLGELKEYIKIIEETKFNR